MIRPPIGSPVRFGTNCGKFLLNRPDRLCYAGTREIVMVPRMFAKGRVVKRWVAGIAVICTAGCGLGAGITPTSPGVTTEFALSETGPDALPPAPPTAQAAIPFAYADPAAPSVPFSALMTGESGSVDVLGVLLDALLVELLAPAGPRLDDSMTFLERLCLGGDDPDFFCRQRYGR